MADADLDQIRRARLQQLREPQGNQPGAGDSNQQDEKKQQEDEIRASLLSQILTPDAADRLNRIRLVKASRAVDVENRLISLAQTGQLRSKVTEEQLKEILGAVSEAEEKRGGGGGGVGRMRVERRRGWDDEDDDLLEL